MWYSIYLFSLSCVVQLIRFLVAFAAASADVIITIIMHSNALRTCLGNKTPAHIRILIWWSCTRMQERQREKKLKNLLIHIEINTRKLYPYPSFKWLYTHAHHTHFVCCFFQMAPFRPTVSFTFSFRWSNKKFALSWFSVCFRAPDVMIYDKHKQQQRLQKP